MSTLRSVPVGQPLAEPLTTITTNENAYSCADRRCSHGRRNRPVRAPVRSTLPVCRRARARLVVADVTFQRETAVFTSCPSGVRTSDKRTHRWSQVTFLPLAGKTRERGVGLARMLMRFTVINRVGAHGDARNAGRRAVQACLQLVI